MAFTATVTERYVQGNKKVVRGTFTQLAVDKGGDVDTGLNRVDSFNLQYTGSVGVISTAATVNESFPHSTAVTVITADGAAGEWRAEGA